jgi:hypothetical protein
MSESLSDEELQAWRAKRLEQIGPAEEELKGLEPSNRPFLRYMGVPQEPRPIEDTTFSFDSEGTYLERET